MRLATCAALVFPALALASVASAQPIQLTAQAKVVQGESGSSVAVTGSATGVPDGTMLHVKLSLLGVVGLREYAEVSGGAFSVSFGPARKVLPGSYSLRVDLDTRLQKRSVGDALRGRTVEPAQVALEVGDGSAAELERARVRRKLERVLESIKRVHDALVQEGSALAPSATRSRIQGPQAPDEIGRSWQTYTRRYQGDVQTIRHDLKEFLAYCLVHYFPAVNPLLSEILTTLDRCHASYTIAIFTNLGLEERIAPETRAAGVFSLKELRRKIPALAALAYKVLGLEPHPWDRLEVRRPETTKDIDGDLFRSSASEFEVRKPGPWRFEVATPDREWRLRMRPSEHETEALVGVEVFPFPAAESLEDLARMHEDQTRNRWGELGFELIKSRRIERPDPGMPGGVRHGEEMHYRVTRGGKVYRIFHHTLFGREHRWTYTLICFAEEPAYESWTASFQEIIDSFKVLDVRQE